MVEINEVIGKIAYKLYRIDLENGVTLTPEYSELPPEQIEDYYEQAMNLLNNDKHKWNYHNHFWGKVHFDYLACGRQEIRNVVTYHYLRKFRHWKHAKLSLEYYARAVEINGYALQYVKEQTPKNVFETDVREVTK